MTTKMKKLVYLAVLLSFGFIVGCQEKSTEQKAGDAVSSAIGDAKKAAGAATNAVKDAAK
jgi:uncharacterized protein (UPF0333 family)